MLFAIIGNVYGVVNVLHNVTNIAVSVLGATLAVVLIFTVVVVVVILIVVVVVGK